MAAFFGEVLPVFSRAVADFDEDEDVAIHKECRVHWTEKVKEEIENSSYIDCRIVIVAEGPTATAFSETCILGESPELVATICEDVEGEPLMDRKHQRPTLHRLRKHPEVIVYKGQEQILPEQAFRVVSQVLEHIPKSANVIVLNTQPAVDYKGASPTRQMRALKTPAFRHKLPCAFIETPNIVAGLGAQVMTHCQVERRPAVLYVLYMENMYFDMSYVTAFRDVLDVSPLKEITKDTVMSPKEVEKKADQFAQSHNFYT